MRPYPAAVDTELPVSHSRHSVGLRATIGVFPGHRPHERIFFH